MHLCFAKKRNRFQKIGGYFFDIPCAHLKLRHGSRHTENEDFELWLNRPVISLSWLRFLTNNITRTTNKIGYREKAVRPNEDDFNVCKKYRQSVKPCSSELEDKTT